MPEPGRCECGHEVAGHRRRASVSVGGESSPSAYLLRCGGAPPSVSDDGTCGCWLVYSSDDDTYLGRLSNPRLGSRLATPEAARV